MPKITIYYADDLADAIDSADLNDYFDYIITQHDYVDQKASEKMAWVKSYIDLSEEKNICFASNDYHLIRLIQSFLPSESFSIYDVDNKITHDDFLKISPNPSLAIGEHIFRFSVRRGLKRV